MLIRLHSILLLLILGAAGAFASAIYEAGPVRSLSPNIPISDALNLQAKVVQAFSRRGCAEIASLAPLEEVSRLPPEALAIVAFCQADHTVQESLFERAETLAPGRVVVQFLRARARWRNDPAGAQPLWRQVESLARDPATRAIVRRYLDGTARGDEMIAIESEWTYYVDARLGAGYQTNPILAPTSTLVFQTSPSLNALLDTGLQRRFRGGTLSADYSLSAAWYTAAAAANLLEHDLALPLSLRAGTNEDIRIRPFGSYFTIGGEPFYEYGGLALQGVAYRGRFRQSVQGSCFVDHYPAVSQQKWGGTHLRFDYAWEYYPETWFARLLFYLEHVQAGRALDTATGGSTPYSHNDIALQSFLEWNLGFTLLGLSTKLVLREDDNNTSYKIGSNTSDLQFKRRQDVQLLLQPSAAFPLGRDFYFILTYFLDRRWSNFGALDISDDTFFNQGAQAWLRFSLEAI